MILNFGLGMYPELQQGLAAVRLVQTLYLKSLQMPYLM
jgi:hypothetical protein